MASYGGYLEILALLLDCQADINQQDHEGLDSLHWAIRRHHPEVVKLLLERGAYPNNIGFVQVLS
jgi:inversin